MYPDIIQIVIWNFGAYAQIILVSIKDLSVLANNPKLEDLRKLIFAISFLYLDLYVLGDDALIS